MTQHNQNDHATIAERLKDIEKIEAVLTEVGHRVILEHARAGRAVPIWRNNQVVWESIEEGKHAKDDGKQMRESLP